MDLETVTIERGRDAGLASFNNARVAYGLNPIRDFSDLNPDLPMDVSDKCFYTSIKVLLPIYLRALIAHFPAGFSFIEYKPFISAAATIVCS